MLFNSVTETDFFFGPAGFTAEVVSAQLGYMLFTASRTVFRPRAAGEMLSAHHADVRYFGVRRRNGFTCAYVQVSFATA